MGIPKFFRWMSERYPMCSQIITENRIPEFDNLYLDMNGIIHNSSHNNNASVHFRISEEQIWLGIFNYVDHLFAKIKPKKLFFLAIDGVAPRAKMNQQRSRRFRSAKDAEDSRKKAIQKGEELPPEEPFDSNCITPGTEFMRKLTIQLRYFINKKVSEDTDWRNVEIVLSGPEVPGEGEHKIMEYIRLARAQDDYDPNTRHCLYGLDADLIMLGLLSHDPHFALLREEVTFGRKTQKKQTSIESQNFYLMHLSVLREYLELEFSLLKETLKSEYDLESILDDFILLAFFIGNDFLPHLPDVHIHEGALTLVFEIYKRVRLTCGGYIQTGGRVDMKRLQLVLDQLADEIEKEAYEAQAIDQIYLAGKRPNAEAERVLLHELEKKKKVQTMTLMQKDFFTQIKDFVLNHKPGQQESVHFPTNLKANDRKFIETLARKLGLYFATEFSADGSKHVYIAFMENEEGTEDESSLDEEAIVARDRVLAKYEKAVVVDELSSEEAAQKDQEKYEANFKQWKANYYKEKMDIDIDNNEQMDELVKSYIAGIQWVLHYYYNGVASWGWFYPYHYAPRISDLVNITRFQDYEFELGRPFKPHEQLMGVLPSLSKKLLPLAYQDLMTDPTSPIIDFYPPDFRMDMNGKKQEWEAVVRIPFIEEKRLLEAMKTREHRLTKVEKDMGQFGESYVFDFDPTLAEDKENRLVYPSPIPNVFPDIYNCCSREKTFHLPTLEGGKTLKKHLLEGVFTGEKALPGFPSLNTLPHTGHLESIGVNVFQQDSKNDTMVVTLVNQDEGLTLAQLAANYIMKPVYIGYPYLQEAKIIAVSNEQETHKFVTIVKGERSRKGRVITKVQEHNEAEQDFWRNSVERVEHLSEKRYGLRIGHTTVALHACPIRRMKLTDRGALIKEYGHPTQAEVVPLQTAVLNVTHKDPRFATKPPPPLSEEFPKNSPVFFLGADGAMAKYYGYPATVVDCDNATIEVEMIVPKDDKDVAEPQFGYTAAKRQAKELQYISSSELAKELGLTGLALSRLTSSLRVIISAGQNVDLGLNLKFDSKKQMVPNYTRKHQNGYWEYSLRARELISAYISEFPQFAAKINKEKRSEMLHIENFGWGDDAKDIVKTMRDWLKQRGVPDFSRVSIALEVHELDETHVRWVEEEADKYQTHSQTMELKRVVCKGIPREALLKPISGEARLNKQTLALGDRVVYCLSSGSVPFAAKGTVVGILDAAVDVVFDFAFMGGHTLGGRCSDHRGQVLPTYSVLRLTHPPPKTNKFHDANRRQQATDGPRSVLSQASSQNHNGRHHSPSAKPHHHHHSNNNKSNKGRSSSSTSTPHSASATE